MFAEKKSHDYEFDTFELHDNGRYFVVGVSGRYVRVFDLEKQHEDQMMKREYNENQNKGNKNETNFKKAKSKSKK